VSIVLWTGDSIDLVARYRLTDDEGVDQYLVELPHTLEPGQVRGLMLPVLPAQSAVAISIPLEP
jgi:hypothetical protein